MAVFERGLESLNFLPDAMRDALRRRLRELGGAALIVLAVVLALALATWSVQDPSLNHATNSPVRNLLGVPGAIVADLLMQLLGVAALAFILPVAIWGWRLLTHRPLKRERIRLLFWIFGVLLSAGCAAALPRSAAWPLPVGLGGVIGDWMLRLAALFSGGAVTGATRISVAIAAGAGTLVCFAFATGFGWRSDKGDPDARAEDHQTPVSILLGWVAHGFLSLKARIARTLTRRPTARAPARREAPPEGRIEPRLEPSVRDIAPRVAPEADEEQHDAALQPSRRPRAAPRAPRRPSRGYVDSSAKLPLCLGKTIGGEPVIVDLARMPHLLIAGTTGSGKSVAINTMILSLLYRLRPDQCRLIMVDPKMLELSVYDGIPHLLTPVVTDPKKSVVALKWAVREMEERYKKMSKLGVRNIDGYNARVADAKAKGDKLTRTVHTGYDRETGEAIYENEELDLEPLPFVVVIVDEMADLMMVAGKDIEGPVQRLAQMARAAGLHVILATQRPSVDVITGTIKANFPTRISFQVTSKIDSRTILGEMGAEQLLGQGDMLYMAGGGRISRVHGPFVSDEEVEKVVRHLKTQGAPEYLEAVTAEEPTDEDGAVFDSTGMGGDGGGDLFSQAVAIVKRDRKASTSYIQRRLQIGYNRAASLMERMELEGIVGQANHAGKPEILVAEEEGGFQMPAPNGRS